MTRIDLITDPPADPRVAAMFDEVRAHGIAVPNLYRVIGHAPHVLRAWLNMAWPLRLEPATPRALRELLILRNAQRSGTLYEWSHHVPMALAAGLGQAKIDAIPAWRDSALFDDAERAVLALADEVTDGPGASAATMAALKRHFDDASVVELVMTASFYVCVGRFLRSMDIQPEDGHTVTPLPGQPQA